MGGCRWKDGPVAEGSYEFNDFVSEMFWSVHEGASFSSCLMVRPTTPAMASSDMVHGLPKSAPVAFWRGTTTRG